MLELHPLSNPVTVDLSMPGSKSVTNRALILGALTENPVEIINPLVSEDVEAMISCLTTLGIRITISTDKIFVNGSIKDIKRGEFDLNARLSGTTIRFITAFSCIVPGIKNIYGEKRLNERPIEELINALVSLGASIQPNGVSPESNHIVLPITITSSSLTGHLVKINGNVSSQFISALLMIGPIMGGLEIIIEGAPLSESYIDLTISMMSEWGVSVIKSNRGYKVVPGDYKMKSYIVEGDYSGAGYFASIAALTNSKILLHNLNPDSKQGDRQFFKILKSMGNKINFSNHGVVIEGSGVKPLSVDMTQCPDQAQTLAVLAAFSQGKSIISGVRSLRVKETERVKAVQTELMKMNIKTESPNLDTLIIYGGAPKPATIDTYNDHRMAMSFAVAGSKLAGMKIKNPEVVNKTFPEFWDKLKKIGVGLK